ncbi:MAG: HIRAN domain-containing protein [Kiritimatiellae bacterium]|nr:HIRAN domain-containing protein [Kiritimatiellia bacterium]
MNLSIAGVAFEGRAEILRRCRLGQEVWLRRESWNAHDSNAIAILDSKGQKLGYVARDCAARLAPHLDADGRPHQAYLTLLQADLAGGVVGASVTLVVPSDWLKGQLGVGRIRGFTCEPRQDGGAYVFADCEEQTIHEIVAAMSSRFRVLRHGYSYRCASDGRHYKWYIALEDAFDEAKIREFFTGTLGWSQPAERGTAAPDHEAAELQQLRRSLEDMTRERDELRAHNERLGRENHQLAEQCRQLQTAAQRKMTEAGKLLTMMEEEIAAAEKKTDSERELRLKAEEQVKQLEQWRTEAERELEKKRELEDRQKRHNAEMIELLCVLCPRTTFVRDSLDVLFTELKEHRHALRLVHQLDGGEHPPNCKRVQRAPSWWEARFSTGEDDSGRLYYRIQRDRCEVLVSFKRSQDRDVAYLASC